MAKPKMVTSKAGNTNAKPRLVKDIGGGGGGGGTTDYNDLSNKPKINNVELKGNKTLEALGIASTEELGQKADKSALTAIYNTEEQLRTDINGVSAELTQFKSDIVLDLSGLQGEIDNKANKTEETQIIGWTKITADTYEELDLTNELNAGKHKFTIIVYIRKGNIRQAVKFELTASELGKVLSKINKNMVCITRSCVDPTNDTKIAMLKQCMEQVYDGDTKVEGHIRLKYGIYTTEGTLITALDNFEWCFYAE